jgi:ParB-like chromosome segregation protein Spo0J
VATATTFEVHPLAELIPPMTEQEYADLKAGIERKGFLPDEPVVLYGGKILDGRHRYKVCGEIGIEPPTRVFEGDEDSAKEYVISKNLDRRHLTTGQRSACALNLLDYEKAEAKERQGARTDLAEPPATSPTTEGKEDRHTSEATAKAGEKFGVSRSSVERARKVAEERPDLHDKVKSGEISVAAAFEQTTGKRIKTGEAITAPSKPLDLSKERNRQRADKQLERLWKLLAALDGARMGLETFDVGHALAAASDEDAEEMVQMITDCGKAFRDLRTDIKTLKGL